jgi:pilus assembly protein CpaB
LLRADDVVWRPAAGVVEPGTVVRPLAAVHTERDEQARNEVSGAALNVDLARGEPIRRSLIVKPGDCDFLQVVLTSGARAIAIPISSVGAGTGLLNPGDRVDVVLTQNFNSEGLAHRSVSETIAQNLRMLAIDPANAQGGRSVMLEVTPDQAEKVGVAAELGKLSLLLRRAGDTAPVSGTADSRARPTWDGDVSHALATIKPAEKVAPLDRPSVGIIRGNKAEAVKQE